MATTRSTSPFKVTGWDTAPYDENVAGPKLFRVQVRKTFTGDLAGEASGELLMCVGDPANLAAGAGYVVSDRVVGSLGGRAGSFVMQHWGHSGPGFQTAAGHIVTGSGTGELTGITGTLEITPDHQFVLDYELKAEG